MGGGAGGVGGGAVQFNVCVCEAAAAGRGGGDLSPVQMSHQGAHVPEVRPRRERD